MIPIGIGAGVISNGSHYNLHKISVKNVSLISTKLVWMLRLRLLHGQVHGPAINLMAELIINWSLLQPLNDLGNTTILQINERCRIVTMILCIIQSLLNKMLNIISQLIVDFI